MVKKHLAMNSASNWRALLDWAFFNSLRRLKPLRPPVLNLRMFSRLRLIFSFLALVRQLKSSVVVVVVPTRRDVLENTEGPTKAYGKRIKQN